ncbi:esterase [candidate division KSB1 bacterium]|nr:esterase [candidate division KSB1 bacterium]
MKRIQIFLIVYFSILLLFVFTTAAQDFRGWTPTPGDTLMSPRIKTDGQVKFSIYAPEADKVRLISSDMPGLMRGAEMTEAENGIWSVTVGPVDPGSYRYNINVDGVSVIDPKNPKTSESNANTWSLIHIDGAEYMDTNQVPHGAVAEVTYYSTSLKRHRRMHVYTPPGYEKDAQKYPVFYLLHGAMDCDDSWSTVGRAGFILDNLIVGNKAKPMIVVMPAGHTGPFSFGGGRGGSSWLEEFEVDFKTDIVPYIENNYRVLSGRKNRAIAGLSMGGAHTLDIAFSDLASYGFIGVYSSGIFGITGGRPGAPEQDPGPSWEESHLETLEYAELKDGLEYFWFATGSDDFLVETSKATVEMFKKHKFDVIYKESSGGHTWINWREYLQEFTPHLFQ